METLVEPMVISTTCSVLSFFWTLLMSLWFLFCFNSLKAAELEKEWLFRVHPQINLEIKGELP